MGGLLTTVNWRLVFGINLPVCIAMPVLLAPVAPPARRPAPFDWAGQAAAVVALTALMYGLITGGAEGFDSLPVVAALALTGVGIAGFLLLQAHGRHPMMPLGHFRSTNMRISLPVGSHSWWAISAPFSFSASFSNNSSDWRHFRPDSR
jgi:DHA2 family methylenomycin A resistance protein-like MFS transporter